MTADDIRRDPMAAVVAWRRQGAAEADPVGLAIVEGLARRAAQHDGQARQWLERRIVQWLAARGSVPCHPVSAATAVAAASPARAGLSALVDALSRPPAATALRGTGRALTLPAAPPAGDLKAVSEFKDTWLRLRAEQRLRQALAQVPDKAGPPNALQVVHRALQAMHTLSPDYLDACMSHIDTLLWLEWSSGAGDLAPRPAARRQPADQAPRPLRRSTAGKDRL